jgi:hypothetical protein
LFVEDETPAPATGYGYLVRAVNLACGQRGSYGTDSSGAGRQPSAHADCP